MEWSKMIMLPKFSTMKEAFKIIGIPQFKFREVNSYYIGSGVVLSYSDICFRIEKNIRIEYGDNGEYAVRVAFFKNSNELEIYCKLEKENYYLDSTVLGEDFEILQNIKMGDSYESVIKALNSKSNCNEGESRSLINGKFVFQYNFIEWSNYTFLFFGKSKKTKMTAVIYTLNEKI